MALHLIPDDGTEHAASGDCPCRPDLVDVDADGGGTRRAWQHRGQADTAAAVET